MSKAKQEPWTEARIFGLLKKLFPEPANVLLPQVRNGTSYVRRARTVDAVGASVWKSRGLYLFGVEIKVSYSDWRKEIEQPDKAESIQQFCQHWWIAAPKGIVPVGEVPETWGLIECGRSAKIIRPAPKLDPIPPDMLFVGSIMRAVQACTTPTSDVRTQIAAAREAGEEYAKSNKESERASLKGRIVSFEERSGVNIDDWSSGQIGEAVAFVRKSGVMSAVNTARRLRDSAVMITEELNAVIEKLGEDET